LSGGEVGSVATDGTLQNLESGTSGRITQSVLLERIASEMNRLKFYIGDEKVYFTFTQIFYIFSGYNARMFALLDLFGTEMLRSNFK
jgi:hypothetical protein